MSVEQLQRPTFYEGQYLGAEDLELTVDYNRFQLARHVLGAHTWGIVAGLELKETAEPSGGVSVTIQPGFAIDGFGRHIVVTEPHSVPLESFDSVTSNPATGTTETLVKVWIRYDASETNEPAYGFGTCDAEDQYARAQEGFVVEVGDRDHDEQHDQLTIAGAEVEALDAPPSRDETDPIICDESVPYQTFPDSTDAPTWLVPLGYVRWDTSDGGSLVSLSDEDDRLSRAFRRYAGSVTESIYATDGLIRLRSRATDPDGVTSPAGLCETQGIRTGENEDLVVNEETERLEVADLVWVEGNLRVVGDAKLFGGRVDFRQAGGSEDPQLLIQRADEANAEGGTDLRLVIGEATDGKNRLAVGPSTGESTISECIAVRDNGDVQLGEYTISRQTSDLLTVSSDAKSPILALCAEDAHIGVGTTAPDVPLHITGGIHADYAEGSGYLMVGDVDDLNVVLDPNEILARDAGAPSQLNLQGDGGALCVHGNLSNTKKVFINEDGDVCIGDNEPGAQLDVRGEIKLGSSGNLFAVGAEETLRVIVGQIEKDGTIVSGDGFKVPSHTVGSYTITFDTSFSALPAIVVAPNGPYFFGNPSITAVDGFTAIIHDGTGTTHEYDFTFIAVGPR